MGVVTLLSIALAVLGATGAASEHVQHADSHGVWVVQTTATVIASAISTAGAQTVPTHPSSGLAQADCDHQESDGSARSAWHTARISEIVLPTSFEAADHTTAAELVRLGKWWQHNAQASGVVDPMLAGHAPTVLAGPRLAKEPYRHDETHAGNGLSVLSAHPFRGQVSSFTIANSETIEAVAVTLSVPHARSSDALQLEASSHAGHRSLMPTVNPWIQQQQQDERLDEVLGSLWRLGDHQAVMLDGEGRAAEVGNSFAVDDEEEVQVEPAQFTLGLQGFSAWALCAYVSVISVLFLATLLWLAFVLVRAGLGMLLGTLFQGSSSSGALPPVQAKCVGTDVRYEVVELHNGDSNCENVSMPLLSS